MKSGVRIVHADKVLEEKLGRNDPCLCGSGRRFQVVLPEDGTLSTAPAATGTSGGGEGKRYVRAALRGAVLGLWCVGVPFLVVSAVASEPGMRSLGVTEEGWGSGAVQGRWRDLVSRFPFLPDRVPAWELFLAAALVGATSALLLRFVDRTVLRGGIADGFRALRWSAAGIVRSRWGWLVLLASTVLAPLAVPALGSVVVPLFVCRLAVVRREVADPFWVRRPPRARVVLFYLALGVVAIGFGMAADALEASIAALAASLLLDVLVELVQVRLLLDADDESRPSPWRVLRSPGAIRGWVGLHAALGIVIVAVLPPLIAAWLVEWCILPTAAAWVSAQGGTIPLPWRIALWLEQGLNTFGAFALAVPLSLWWWTAAGRVVDRAERGGAAIP